MGVGQTRQRKGSTACRPLSPHQRRGAHRSPLELLESESLRVHAPQVHTEKLRGAALRGRVRGAGQGDDAGRGGQICSRLSPLVQKGLALPSPPQAEPEALWLESKTGLHEEEAGGGGGTEVWERAGQEGAGLPHSPAVLPDGRTDGRMGKAVLVVVAGAASQGGRGKPCWAQLPCRSGRRAPPAPSSPCSGGESLVDGRGPRPGATAPWG